MLALLIAYLAVWIGTLLYILRLAAAQRRLQRALAGLQRRAEPLTQEAPTSKAA